MTENERFEINGKNLREIIMNQPSYYIKDGLSPIDAFKQGLMSNEEFIGFCKGNIIKYVVRCQYKDNPVKDLDKAMDYIKLLKEVV